MHEIIWTKDQISEELFAPVRSEKQFSVNLTLFCESQNFNTYLNRKVVIAANGEIKNAPNSKIEFGNYNSAGLSAIVNTKEFQSLWHVKKDDIEVCKECEYRHMCLDNRIPVKKEDKWIHETNCLYDVYTGRWNTN